MLRKTAKVMTMKASYVKMPYNKRMQSDQPTRYARELAADARRYVAGTLKHSAFLT